MADAKDIAAYGDYLKSQGKSQADIDAYTKYLSDNHTTPAEPSPEDEHSIVGMSGKGFVQGALNALPTIGGIAGAAGGAILGTGAAPGVGTLAGGVAGAAAGGVAGESLKTTLQSALFGNAPKSREEMYGNLATAAKEQAMGEMVGQTLPVIAKAMNESGASDVVAAKFTGAPAEAIKTYRENPDAVKQMAQESGGDEAFAANNLRQKNAMAVAQTKAEFEAPTHDLVSSKTINGSDREVGDYLKSAIQQDVTAKYGPFKKSYEAIDQVNRELPVADEARYKFTQDLKKNALNDFGENNASYSTVNKYAHEIDASNNGAQLQATIDRIKQAKNQAWQSQATHDYGLLSDLLDKTTDFYDGQIKGLATKVSAGKGSMEEMSAFQRLMEAQKNPTTPVSPENLSAYTKSVANDYLKHLDNVDSNYAGFKQFLNGVEGQTGVKGGSTVRFLQKLEATPSEKLVGKIDDLFDKNTAALEKMRSETPQAFDAIQKYRTNSIAQKSMDASGQIDATKFHDMVSSLQPEARNLLFTKDEQQLMSKVANNPKLVRLNELANGKAKPFLNVDHSPGPLLAAGEHSKEGQRILGELSQLTGQNMLQDAKTLFAMKTFAKPSRIGSGLGATVGGAVGGAVGGGLGGIIGAGEGVALGTAAGGVMSSPASLKSAIDMTQFAKPITQNQTFQSAVGQGVMAGARGVNSLATSILKPN